MFKNKKFNIKSPLISSIKVSNENHKNWIYEILQDLILRCSFLFPKSEDNFLSSNQPQSLHFTVSVEPAAPKPYFVSMISYL